MATWAPIVGLLNCRGPSAIPGRVWPVIVDTVDAVTRRWTRPHVGVEPLEGFPLGTDGNPATAVVLITTVTWVSASRPHGHPDLILGNLVGETMSGPQYRSRDWPPAPTRNGASATELGTDNRADRAAIALTDPLQTCTVSDRILSNDDQSPETLSGLVLDTIVWHRGTPNSVVSGPFGDLTTVGASLRQLYQSRLSP